ncbi:Expp1 protein [Hirschfeldia incana]|nr:Expp1 protein [Hirschfeldia incana]
MARSLLLCFLFAAALTSSITEAADDNRVYSPCSDSTVAIGDGFTFGIVFAARDSFFGTNRSVQYSPCDRRRLSLNGNSELAVFRPKVDEITLLTINTSSSSSSFRPDSSKGYMVAFAGAKYAARSVPIMVADNDHVVTSFTLVLEFQKGRLQNLFWKKDGCSKCSGNAKFVCLNKEQCAIRRQSCKNQGGQVDCSLGVQLAFSGTDKHYTAMNSWYEVANLQQYSLYGLYSNLKNSLSSQFSNFF